MLLKLKNISSRINALTHRGVFKKFRMEGVQLFLIQYYNQYALFQYPKYLK
jgi:hypothetical protein